MAQFTLTLAQTVRVYGEVTVNAETAEQAAEIARMHAADGNVKGNVWDNVTDVEYSTACEETIISIENEDSSDVFCDCIELTDDAHNVISAEQLAKAMVD